MSALGSVSSIARAQAPVEHLARPALVVELVGALDQPHQPDDVGRVHQLAPAVERVAMVPERASEMGELLLGTADGRESRDELTVYESMGHPIEDIAAAGLVYTDALRQAAGTTFDR